VREAVHFGESLHGVGSVTEKGFDETILKRIKHIDTGCLRLVLALFLLFFLLLLLRFFVMRKKRTVKERTKLDFGKYLVCF